MGSEDDGHDGEWEDPDDDGNGGDGDSEPPQAPPVVDQGPAIPPLRVYRFLSYDLKGDIREVKVAGHVILFPQPDVAAVYEFVEGPDNKSIFQFFRRAVRGYYDISEVLAVTPTSVN